MQLRKINKVVFYGLTFVIGASCMPCRARQQPPRSGQAACQRALTKLPPIDVYDLHCKAKTPSAACRIPGVAGSASVQDVFLFWQ
ncbi:hypothetical protein [Acidithiobacillus sp. AMEEHan]|uniref:hypothetical protein n=1 Tax=Acidithiobacillus sp. AMEEHan TaxID=2994951 RepID=UPI0027E47065|nr:hypothetical protein [Acidithiobacillus sp. AMEEHan]